MFVIDRLSQDVVGCCRVLYIYILESLIGDFFKFWEIGNKFVVEIISETVMTLP